MRPHTTKFRRNSSFFLCRVIQAGRSILLEVIVSVNVRRKFQTNMCLISNGYQDRDCWNLQIQRQAKQKCRGDRTGDQIQTLLNDLWPCNDDSLREIKSTGANTDTSIYCITNTLACYMFRPTIVAIFTEVFFERYIA